ncbi:non-ribosomal peptide synthetase [Chitinophaga rhizophila]|uniref:Amino acid adenylation domain-containing protein n=1 Tax=Chitinophaga rhizophila TaxID=2866212 RepID=A0ABS7GHM7_9BACT|nr:non-ribosomal peptide synthetase [Chitinophaga rhizophila]MBW8687205.1 amino acid adenylation domain-containing protein [Chitinophaga rhizophila]
MIELIRKLRQLNIRVQLEGDGLKIICPENETVPADLLQELKANKSSLVEYYKNAIPASVRKIKPIPAVAKADNYAVSNSQQRLWLLSQLDKEQSVAYNMTGAFIMTGKLDISAWEQAFTWLLQRHESLRTIFPSVDGVPLQHILPAVPTDNVLRYDTRRMLSDDLLEQEIHSFSRQQYDLDGGPLIKAAIIPMGDNRHAFLFGMHHIISDGWSMGILIRELLSFYQGSVEGRVVDSAPLTIHYKDFSAWEAEQLQTTDMQQHREFWLNQLSGTLPVLELPVDGGRPDTQSFSGRIATFRLEKGESVQFQQLCQQHGASVYMGVMAAVNVLLYRYTGQHDLLVGSPVSGRIHPDLEDQIGCYVNTLCFRNTIEAADNFTTLLKSVKEGTINAFEHQSYPFDLLIEDLQVKRMRNRSLLFDVMVVMQGEDVLSHIQLPGLDIEVYRPVETSCKFDLTFSFVETTEGIQLDLEYNTGLFTSGKIERMGQHLMNIIRCVCQQPQTAIADISMLGAAEVSDILSKFNRLHCGYPSTMTVVSLFEQQVSLTPDNIALTSGSTQVTYQQLSERSNQLAHLLKERYNVVRGDLVGLMYERSEEMIYAIMAVIKLGAVYVPLDPAVPSERIAFILADAAPKVVLTDGSVTTASLVAYVNTCQTDYASFPGDNLHEAISPADAIYMIYTSGTTGNPKGVRLSHRNVVRLLKNDAFPFDFNEKDVWTMFHSYAFDFSVWEMYGALLFGGRLVIVPKSTSRNVAEYIALITAEKVTVLNQTPSAFRQLLQAEADGNVPQCASLRYLIFGGEALQPAMLDVFSQQYPQCRIINMYGITETTVHVTIKEITAAEIAADKSNIGIPIPTLSCYVLDENRKLLPVGVPGELYVGGEGVAIGYHNREELNAERFLPDPFNPGGRMYKSGDLVYVNEAGDMEYLGRKDNQVKIRGHRVELGEIEFKMAAHALVDNAVVVAAKDGDGNTFLAAYVVSGDPAFAVAPLLADLRKTLPEYMLPAVFIRMDALPLTANGKIDRKALPPVTSSNIASVAEYVPPATQEEVMLTAIWEQLLERSPIGIHDNFFEIGGHSLKATRMVSAIYKQCQVKLDLKQVFYNPTIHLLAREIEVILWMQQDAADSGIMSGEAINI